MHNSQYLIKNQTIRAVIIFLTCILLFQSPLRASLPHLYDPSNLLSQGKNIVLYGKDIVMQHMSSLPNKISVPPISSIKPYVLPTITTIGIIACIGFIHHKIKIWKNNQQKDNQPEKHYELINNTEMENDIIDFLINHTNYTILTKANVASIETRPIKEKIQQNSYYGLNYILNDNRIQDALISTAQQTKTWFNILFNFLFDKKLNKVIELELPFAKTKTHAKITIENGSIIDKTDFTHSHHNDLIESKNNPNIIRALNILWKMKKQFGFFKPNTRPWEPLLFNKVFTTLCEKSCKGELHNKDFCIHTVKCRAARIIAAYKEYMYQNDTLWKSFLSLHALPQQKETQEQATQDRAREQAMSNLTSLLNPSDSSLIKHSSLTLEQLNDLYDEIQKLA